MKGFLTNYKSYYNLNQHQKTLFTFFFNTSGSGADVRKNVAGKREKIFSLLKKKLPN